MHVDLVGARAAVKMLQAHHDADKARLAAAKSNRNKLSLELKQVKATRSKVAHSIGKSKVVSHHLLYCGIWCGVLSAVFIV